MIRVLFVCLGNICRSPSAEAVFRALVQERGFSAHIETDSAGTGAWHVGNPPDERAQLVGRKYGIEMSDLRARQATPEDFHVFDIILAMDHSNHENLKRMRPSNGRAELAMMMAFAGRPNEEVPDPYYGDLSDYETVFDMLKPAADGLLDHILSEMSDDQGK